MADITLSYKGATISEISASGTKTLKTAGKYCEDDITLQYVKPSGGGSYVGGTVAWNQLSKELNSTNWTAESGVTASYTDGVATISSTTANNGIKCNTGVAPVAGHKYYLAFAAKSDSPVTLKFGYASASGVQGIANTTSSFARYENIKNCTTATLYGQIFLLSAKTYSNVQVKDAILIDLTAMFGSSIADYAYTLESGTAGAGIAWLKANGFFNSAYYPYDAGTLKSVETFAHQFKDSNGKIIGYFPMNFDLELRGIPKLDANNVLYYDGDEYDGNGTVTRKCGVRAYTSGDATDGSTMITDGTNTVYKLATPTTETV